MKLKVVSDGTSHGTQIIDSETGKPLERVSSVDIHLDVYSHLTMATVKTFKSELLFEAEFTTREQMLKEFCEWLYSKKLGVAPLPPGNNFDYGALVKLHLKSLERTDATAKTEPSGSGAEGSNRERQEDPSESQCGPNGRSCDPGSQRS
jgi:hypothetical protein